MKAINYMGFLRLMQLLLMIETFLADLHLMELILIHSNPTDMIGFPLININFSPTNYPEILLFILIFCSSNNCSRIKNKPKLDGINFAARISSNYSFI